MNRAAGPQQSANVHAFAPKFKESSMTGLNRCFFQRTIVGGLGLLFASIFMCGVCLAQKDIQQQRQEILTALLTTDPPFTATEQRWVCINGNEPSRVKEARTMGMDFTPDASDSCVAALRRSAKDRSLTEPYKKLLTQTGGDIALTESLPKAIGAAVLDGNVKVSIGKGKAITPTAPMAFDAGFAVAYTSAAPKKEGDPQKLKSLAESCLAGGKDAGTCFSVGYVYGAQAFNAR
jgi:hypothetical protein